MIHSQRGSAFVFSLILMVVASLLFLMVQTLSWNTDVSLQRMRAKAEQSAVEHELRAFLNSPVAYAGCASTTVTGVSGVTHCLISATALAAIFPNPKKLSPTDTSPLACPLSATGDYQCFVQAYPGICTPASTKIGCGFTITVAQKVGLTAPTVAAGTTVKAVITFDGDFSLNVLEVVANVPSEALQQTLFTCPDPSMGGPSKPIFAGFDSTGAAICRSVPKPTCGTGEMAIGVDSKTGSVRCATFPSGTFGCCSGGSCSSDPQMITQFKWSQNSFGDPGCHDRNDPFTYFGGP